MQSVFLRSQTVYRLSSYVIKRSAPLRPYYEMSTSAAPIENSIRSKLSSQLETSHLEIVNESYMHNVPKGSETHFKVVVVSDKFTDLPLIKRHRLINEILKHELENGVHALSIVAKTPSQWNSSDQRVESSPACRGGFGK